MTQPAVTFQVRQLEEHLDTRLFDRGHNRVDLTEAGQIVHDYATRIFALYGDMECSVRELTGRVDGTLTIGVSPTVAEYLLPGLLGEFNRRYPDAVVQLRMADSDGILSMVEHNSVDLGLIETAISSKHLAVEVCRRDRLVAIMHPEHPLADRDSVSLDELLAYPFICREGTSITRDALDQHLERQLPQGTLDIAMALGSAEAVKGAVEAGLGVSVVSLATLQKELALGTLVAVALQPPIERPISFVHQKQRFRLHIIEDMLELARAYCKVNSS